MNESTRAEMHKLLGKVTSAWSNYALCDTVARLHPTPEHQQRLDRAESEYYAAYAELQDALKAARRARVQYSNQAA